MSVWMSECSYCEEKAIWVDDVFGPPAAKCCDNPDCMQKAMERLFEVCMKYQWRADGHE